MHLLKNSIFQHISVVFLFFVLSSYITYPLLFNLDSLVLSYGDELLISWIQNWVIYSIDTSVLNIFNANIFYPYLNTLAYSDAFITSSLLSYLPKKIINEPIVPYTFTLFISFFLLGLSVFYLINSIVKDKLISIFSGILVIFSPVMLDKSVHVQILSVYCVLFSLLFFIKFLKSNKSLYLLISLLFFILQMYNSFMPGYFIFFGFVTFLLMYVIRNKVNILHFVNYKNTAISLLTFLIIVPIIIPYLQVSHDFSYTRDIRDTIHFALQPEDYFFTNSFSRLLPILSSFQEAKPFPSSTDLKPGFLGLTISVLLIFSVFLYIREFKKYSWITHGFFICALLGFILSLGPALHLGRQTIHEPFPIPLPYALFYYVLPGFNGFRNSARFEVMGLLYVIPFIAIVLSHYFVKIKNHKYIVIVLIVVAILEANVPLQFISVQKYSEFPPIYSFINTLPKNSNIVELPIYNWNTTPYGWYELRRNYFSSIHFKRTLNGASGYSPIEWEMYITQLLKEFPKDSTVRSLKTIGINYIIIHANEYNDMCQANYTLESKQIKCFDSIKSILDNNTNLKFIKNINDSYVYSL